MTLTEIKSYLKLLPQGLKNPVKVLNGWINDAKFEKGTLDKPFMEEVIRRRTICSTCPFNSKFHPPDPNRNDEYCVHCGCPIVKKTACFECNCGIEVYNQKNPDNPQELKWIYFTNQQTNDENQDQTRNTD